MKIGPPDLTLGRRSKQPAYHFTCPHCEGSNGTMTFIWRGFAADGPVVTRCDDCGYCDRCGKADT